MMTALSNCHIKYTEEKHEDEMDVLRIKGNGADILIGWDEKDHHELVYLATDQPKWDWDKIDPGGRHRDAVHETMQDLLDAAAKSLGVDLDKVNWTLTKE